MSSMSRLVSRFVPQDVFDGDEADQLSLSRNEDYPGLFRQRVIIIPISVVRLTPFA
jgi:hypothetical protein